MQAEESVKIEHGLARNINARPHGVILLLAVRHHDVQTVSRAALKNYDQPLGADARLSRAHGGTSKEARHCCGSDDGKRAVAKKDATRNSHKGFP